MTDPVLNLENVDKFYGPIGKGFTQQIPRLAVFWGRFKQP